MPQKLMRLLLKHYGIFYISERGKRLSVFLTEAYDEKELTDKCLLVRWREKVLQRTGYRGRLKNLGTFGSSSDSEDYLLGGDGASGDDDAVLEVESENSDGTLDDCSISDDSEMELGDMDEFSRE
uniref:PORR domain-containing protein n=1 Tax=Arundo donax TaxID=35708 RepID=A0A0A9C548_ARUDO